MKRIASALLAACIAVLALPAHATDAKLDLANLPVVSMPASNQTFGKVYMPRLKSKLWGEPLIAGVATRQLDAGIGWFRNTALPGQLGNFAVAGHRATHSEPLAYVDKIKKGDKLFIKTAAAWYVYTMIKDQITQPTATWVIDPVPGDAWDVEPTERLVTIVTCEPRWGHAKRWIWWGKLTAAYPPQMKLADVVAA